ncbi:elongation factor G, partial [bacterium]|nr:elongation factor G [bacterium]
NEGEEEKISTGLQALQAEDPTFKVIHSAELNQIIIAGQGEMQLQILVEKLKTRFGVEARLSEPGVPFRETITANADEKYRHKKQSGGAGQFAEVWMRIEPLERGADFEFESKVVGGNISQSFIPAIEKGVKQVMERGVVSGHKVVDVKAVVYDGKEHPVDSKDIAFQIAGREVFKMAVKNAKPILLEPIFDIRVKVPEDYMGDVMGDISSRRGKIQGMEAEGRYQVINAKVPLADLYRYCTHLRSMTQGRGLFSRTFSHYEKMPDEEARKVISGYESKEEE